MHTFSKRSKKNLDECHNDLKRLFYKIIELHDCSVICGYRGRDEQELAFKEGKSKAMFGQSKHNITPSFAVDVVPYPVDWNDVESFKKFGTLVKSIADEMGINLVWGGDFKTFKDYPHYELKKSN